MVRRLVAWLVCGAAPGASTTGITAGSTGRLAALRCLSPADTPHRVGNTACAALMLARMNKHISNEKAEMFSQVGGL